MDIDNWYRTYCGLLQLPLALDCYSRPCSIPRLSVVPRSQRSLLLRPQEIENPTDAPRRHRDGRVAHPCFDCRHLLFDIYGVGVLWCLDGPPAGSRLHIPGSGKQNTFCSKETVEICTMVANSIFRFYLSFFSTCIAYPNLETFFGRSNL